MNKFLLCLICLLFLGGCLVSVIAHTAPSSTTADPLQSASHNPIYD